MLQAYRAHSDERKALGIPPLPLSAKQTGGQERLKQKVDVNFLIFFKQ
jgi:aconitase B